MPKQCTRKRAFFIVLLLLSFVECGGKTAAAAAAAAALASNSRNRARYHPRGIPPEYGRNSVRGTNDLEAIRRFIFGGETLTPAPEPASVLIDGNNVRSFAGFHRLSTLELTALISIWRDQIDALPEVATPDVVVAWDGGGGCRGNPSACGWPNNVDGFSHESDSNSSPSGRRYDAEAGVEIDERSRTASFVAAFSGSDLSADDVIVQCCCFLDESCDRIAVFTSDSNLGQRCQLQCRSAAVQVFHSIHLVWLLEESREVVEATDRDVGEASFLSSSDCHLTRPDFWEGKERRSQVEQLRTYMESKEVERIRRGRSAPTCVERNSLSRWINAGRPGLSIGRVTRIGSIMYEINRS